MENNNYDLLMEQLEQVRQENAKLRKDFDEIVSFNKTLLNRSESVVKNPQGDRKEFLRKQLEGGLKRG